MFSRNDGPGFDRISRTGRDRDSDGDGMVRMRAPRAVR
jgi:hypothetical protein